MDKNKIAIIGTGNDDLDSLMRIRLSELIKKIPTLPLKDASELESESIVKEVEYLPVSIVSLSMLRKAKSPYRCDGKLKKGHRR